MWFHCPVLTAEVDFTVRSRFGEKKSIPFSSRPSAIPSFSLLRLDRIAALAGSASGKIHAAKPSFEGIAAAPKGVIMETPAQIRRWAASLRQQVQTEAMPPGNMTEITAEERAKLIAWVAAGAPLD